MEKVSVRFSVEEALIVRSLLSEDVGVSADSADRTLLSGLSAVASAQYADEASADERRLPSAVI